MNAVEEAVAEELLPYKELFATVVPQQDHEQLLHLVFMFTAATNLVMENSCANMMNSNVKVTNSKLNVKVMNSIVKLMNSIANGTNSTAKVMDSNANGTKSIAKVMNSIAKTCSVANFCVFC